MIGFDLQEGQYIKKPLTEIEIMGLINPLLVQKTSLASSYKYALLNALIECSEFVDANYTIRYNQLFYVFVEKYWWLVINNGLRQMPKTKDGRKTLIERILCDAAFSQKMNKYNKLNSIADDELEHIVNRAKGECNKYVFGALFADTKKVLYSFSNENEKLTYNPQAHKLFYIKKDELIRRIDYAWSELLSKFNNKTIPEILKVFGEYDKANAYSCILCSEGTDMNKTDTYTEEPATEDKEFELDCKIDDSEELIKQFKKML